MSKPSKDNEKIDLQIKGNEEAKKSHREKNEDLDEWKRLEKWQIGRRRFC